MREFINIIEGHEQAANYTKITNDFIDNMIAVAKRGNTLFDLETRSWPQGYTVIITTKVPGPHGYIRIFFRVLRYPSGVELLKDITIEEDLGAFKLKPKTKRIPVYDELSIKNMSVEQYRKEMLQRTRYWRYLFFGTHGLISLIHRWTVAAAAWKAMRLVDKEPPPVSGEVDS